MMDDYLKSVSPNSIKREIDLLKNQMLDDQQRGFLEH